MVCVETLADWWNEIGCISSVFSSKVSLDVSLDVSNVEGSRMSNVVGSRWMFRWMSRMSNVVGSRWMFRWKFRWMSRMSKGLECRMSLGLVGCFVGSFVGWDVVFQAYYSPLLVLVCRSVSQDPPPGRLKTLLLRSVFYTLCRQRSTNQRSPMPTRHLADQSAIASRRTLPIGAVSGSRVLYPNFLLDS